MTSPWWNDDEQLLMALGEALHAGAAVPHRFVAAGRAAYAWHNIDAELAALTYDSAFGGVAPVVRAEQAALRALTFASAHVSIQIEVTRDALHGQVIPPQEGEIELEPPDGAPVVFVVDEVGWFVIHPLPTGWFRLRYRAANGAVVLTDRIGL